MNRSVSVIMHAVAITVLSLVTSMPGWAQSAGKIEKELGVAYLAQAARAFMPGGHAPDAMSATQKGLAALRRALQLNPEHAGALAQLGGVQALMGSFMQAPAMTARGVAQMNRAIEIAPTLKRARLQRAFSGLNLPDTLRNNAAEAEDLDFLIEAAGAGRAGDYVRLMRADLYFETGKPEQARALYQTVEIGLARRGGRQSPPFGPGSRGIGDVGDQSPATRGRRPMRHVPRGMTGSTTYAAVVHCRGTPRNVATPWREFSDDVYRQDLIVALQALLFRSLHVADG